ncbi:hypothetical protein [Acinetobacter sp. GSS19]|uniref:hypothetical protein n=1 Tax=Acinetobacter sp. GSS19 TaxID=3020716 RepID=UPI0023621AC1|nr:hypothetical protein [Acinetobacter sp. GSS19]
MSEASLFLLQSRFADTPLMLDRVRQIYGPGDQILLMGEAVLFVEDTRLHDLPVSILATDAEILVKNLPEHIQVLDQNQFAALVLQFTRCITLK